MKGACLVGILAMDVDFFVRPIIGLIKLLVRTTILIGKVCNIIKGVCVKEITKYGFITRLTWLDYKLIFYATIHLMGVIENKRHYMYHFHLV